MQHQQYSTKVGDEGPIWPRCPPLPKLVRPVRDGIMLEGEVRGRGAVGEGDVEKQQVDEDHEEGLDEQRSAEMRAEPIEHFEDAGDEHDERDVEGEAGRAARAVHRVDLVAIAGDGARCDEDRCNVLDKRADEVAHLVLCGPVWRGSHPVSDPLGRAWCRMYMYNVVYCAGLVGRYNWPRGWEEGGRRGGFVLFLFLFFWLCCEDWLQLNARYRYPSF